MSSKIIIAGDFFISDEFRDNALIDESIKDLFHTSDYRIINLEAPITSDEPNNKIIKTGPHLRMSESTVLPFLKQLEVDAVTLANNHILDYGAKGLTDTFEAINKNKINYVGAGKNLNEAAKLQTLRRNGLRIGILNFCENEWSIAEQNSSGANPMDIIDNCNQIKEAKESHDKVICIIHGGHEHYHLPSPRMVKQYQFYVDNGADLVIGHHTHCISGMEIYRDKPIYYSLGNFLFTKPSNFKDWYKGIVLEVEIGKDIKIATKPIFVQQKKTDFKLSLAEGSNLANLEKQFKTYSRIIQNESELKSNWKNYILDKYNLYDNYWSPLSFIKNKWIKKAANRLQLKGANREGKTLFLNLMRCEAHADISKEILRKKLPQ